MMAAETSPGTGRLYGVERVCRAWDVARSSFYARRRQHAGSGPRPATSASRPGPKPPISDEALLAAIRADLQRSPWTGEGYRKVWARLRVLDGIHVARKRVLRVMRENALLSPYRQRPRPSEAHERRITTDAPNLMWGTDATQIATVEDGRVWLFAVVEHWNAEALGWHVTERGDRFAAVQAVGMAVKRLFGTLAAGAARGVMPRHDHGSAFMADHFQKQIRFWGVAPSYAFVAEPETNGVAERFLRTLKEQIVHGRVYQTIDEVRAAVRLFIDGYNAAWLIEKNGLKSPLGARAAWERELMAAAA
jgi:putative transposase